MRDLLRRMTARSHEPNHADLPRIEDDEAEAAAAAYWSRIGADLPLDERRMRGKAYAAGLPRQSLC